MNPLSRAILLIIAMLAPAILRAEGRAIIVLDASGSMWDELGGRPKVEIAREALNAVLRVLPDDAELGLLAYGHREKGNCADIELIVPPATGRAAAISTAAEFMNFTGKTPLTDAVRQAAAALGSENQPATVILITDGVDNCEGDPCALGLELEDTGADFTAHVVGFGLTPDERETVACLAGNTGGSYLQADDLAALTQALERTVLISDGPAPIPDPTPLPEPAPAPQPLPEPAPTPIPAPTPPPVSTTPNFAPIVLLGPGRTPIPANDQLAFALTSLGPDGTPVTGTAQFYDGVASIVPPGRYRMETQLGAVVQRQDDLTIPPTGIATPEVVLNAAAVVIRPRIGPNAAVEDATTITIDGPNSLSISVKAGVKTWLPPGDYTITATLDAVTVQQPLTVTAGDTVDHDIFISAAAIVPKVFYIPGMAVADATMQIEIVAARPNVDGGRTVVSSRTGLDPIFHLGAGDYVAITYLGLAQVETPFSIALVQRTELPIVLNAGVLAASAPGADHLVIKSPPDIAGNSAAGFRIVSDITVLSMNAGPYLVQASFGEQIVEAPFSITPGERTEITLAAP